MVSCINTMSMKKGIDKALKVLAALLSKPRPSKPFPELEIS